MHNTCIMSGCYVLHITGTMRIYSPTKLKKTFVTQVHNMP